jgi:hypothetical protein
MQLTRWEAWNGFLVRCPECHGVNGKEWGKLGIYAGLFFNAFSFFFLMRPKRAALAFAAFVMGFAFLGAFEERLPDNFGLILGTVLVIAPAIINAVLVVKQQTALNRTTLRVIAPTHK